MPFLDLLQYKVRKKFAVHYRSHVFLIFVYIDVTRHQDKQIRQDYERKYQIMYLV